MSKLRSRANANNNSTHHQDTSQLPQAESTGVYKRSVHFLNRLREPSDGTTPFAGRLGGNGAFTLDRHDPDNASILSRVPDAAPNLTFSQAFDMRGFAEPVLYQAGIIEMFGTFLIVFATVWFAISPNEAPPPPDPAGVQPFVIGLVAGLNAGILIAMVTYGFGAVSGAHFNPLITLGTFFGRLTTFPRCVIYITAQVAGATLAGLMLRAAQASLDFKVGGCFKFAPATTSNALTLEFMACLLALFLAFGIGLDPRQRNVYGPALAPALVGGVVWTLVMTFGFALPGYGGASLNPTRCFGAYVATGFPGWHWIHWVGPTLASMCHGLVYFLVPPEAFEGQRAVEERKLPYMMEREGLGGQHGRVHGGVKSGAGKERA